MTSATSDEQFTAILHDLARVQQELADAPDDDYALRQDLRDRESALREQMRALNDTWTDYESIDQVKRRIKVLEDRLEAHYGNRLSHTSGGQTGFGGGLDPQILHWMHRAMDKTADLPAMKAELVRLKDKLAKLEGN